MHITYYGKDVKGVKVKYVTDSYSIATDPNNFVTKSFNYYLYQIATCLHELLYYRRSELFWEDVDLSKTFNHCTVLLNYAHPKLKHHSVGICDQ